MLNPKTGERELAYIVSVGWVRPIEGADNIELIGINGWTCIARKGEFKAGDLAVYFEIDSKLPVADWSAFMEPKNYKVKTMKLGKFKVISQGLALPVTAFGWKLTDPNPLTKEKPLIITHDPKRGYLEEGDFVTKYLGVTYSVAEDNVRKASSFDKYKKMAQRNPKIFQKPFVKWLYKRTWGKKLLFIFFGKKKDKREWPAWVRKTDEERIQNMPWILEDKKEWYATEKIDGTSATFTMKGFGRKRRYYVGSRNVIFNTPEKSEQCYYDANVYLEMAEKYHMQDVLATLLDERKNTLEFVTIQGETYGKSIQKREYGLKDHNLAVFNLIFGYKDGTTRRCNPREMTDILSKFNVPCVPIVDEHFIMPNTVEELLTIATGKSKIDGGMREGLVFRSKDGEQSFKAVSNEFLLKYHN